MAQLPVELGEPFEDALLFAVRAHASQRRKGSPVPYAAHLLGVTALVLEYGGTETEAIAALLHDAVEDQGGPAMREQIRQRFGEEVTAIVDGCSDTDTVPKPPWKARKEAYLAHLAHASPSVLLVSAADKLHNVRTLLADYRTLGEDLWGRFTGGRDGTLWYYRAVADALRAAAREPRAALLAEELARSVSELEALAGSAG